LDWVIRLYLSDREILSKENFTADILVNFHENKHFLKQKDINAYKGLEALGENPKEYKFENLDPVQVGVVLQTKKIKAGVTWNPVVMETLKANPKVRRLFDSSLIKGHIVELIRGG